MRSNLARQAIYNTDQYVVAYELLFREGQQNAYPNIASQDATNSVLQDLFSEEGAGVTKVSHGLPCFVNFCYDSLIKGTALQCPPQNLVVEVLEDCQADDALYNALSKLKYQGYQIALDDFVPNADWLPFLDLADYVKIDFRAQPLDQIAKFINIYRPYFNFKLLAEKVETNEEYVAACALGFDLFQGFQLSKPERLYFSHVA